jgi:glycosyltransferase involved in cell wall biosynthesis
MSRTQEEIEYTLGLRSPPLQPLPSGVRVVMDSARVPCGRFDLPGRCRRWWLERRDPPALHDIDLFHAAGFSIPHRASLKSIVTVYDMIPEEWFSVCIEGIEQSIEIKRQALERATLLPCISMTTRDELGAFYPDLKKRTRLVPLGIDRTAWQSDLIKAPARSAALFVGQRGGYKNFRIVLEAMRHARWPKELTVRVCGPAFSSAERLWLQRFHLSQRIEHLGTVTDQQLRDEYQSAVCLILPSLQEGFGMPCLEAQAASCPLVCSDIPVFHEVAGEAAMFFDPRLGESLAVAVSHVLDPTARQRLIEQGAENIQSFSWETTAQKMTAVYREAAES